jgi:hypothetical protein
VKRAYNGGASNVGVSVKTLLEEIASLRGALLNTMRENTDKTDALAELRITYTNQRDRYQEERNRHYKVLSDIRDYAIKTHEEGTICKDGLNEFLRHFDMDTYQTLVRVEFTITGSYLVDSDDTSSAAYDARNYLKVDFSGVDDIYGDEDPTDYNVRADADVLDE